jgi:arylsulfatase A-like enzyme
VKAVLVMFDSLNRAWLPPYGCGWTRAPNFERLSQRALTYDASYVGSMPCMPARRDFHTGRLNFLHRSWGPLEPFDHSLPEILRQSGVGYCHLVTDHYHYWEDGGATYHNRYSSSEFIRGQEGDAWKGIVEDDPNWPEVTGGNAQSDQTRRQDRVNRSFLQDEELRPQAQTFAAGLDFVRRNHGADNWLLQIETFDPHEPFWAPEKFRELYPHSYDGPIYDWPSYGRVWETVEQSEHLRHEYAALVSTCDHYLGQVLDAFDEHDLWRDTMLVVWTDHGFLLGEHEQWGKMRTPWYETLARTPFWMHDPRSPAPNERRQALVQPAIDLCPTLLKYFGAPIPPEVLGKDLQPVIHNDERVRDAVLFGQYGGQVNVSDGRWVYMRATQDLDVGLHQYTLMPTHMRNRFGIHELQGIEITTLPFSRGAQVMKIPTRWVQNQHTPNDKGEVWLNEEARSNLLFDLECDPEQKNPVQSLEHRQRMRITLFA